MYVAFVVVCVLLLHVSSKVQSNGLFAVNLFGSVRACLLLLVFALGATIYPRSVIEHAQYVLGSTAQTQHHVHWFNDRCIYFILSR